LGKKNKINMEIRKEIKGNFVKLERLNNKHYDVLKKLSKSKEIWDFMMLDCSVESTFNSWFKKTVDDNLTNQICSFVIKDETNTYGTVGLKNYSKSNNKVEAGSLWIGREFWGKRETLPIRLEAALLIYKYCFEKLNVNKIEFRVDYKNKTAQKMNLKLGAKYDGNLRQDVKVKGEFSDSYVYSILALEWADVKGNLNNKLSYFKK
jgi:RimJ/RimL family protein N-acetyltransferase